MAWSRNPIETEEELKTIRISPTSINTFFSCPRKWYHEYIKAETQDPSIHLLRGSVVHKVLEEVFRQGRYPSGEKFRPAIMAKAMQLFNSHWEESIGPFEMDQKEKEDYYEESKVIINNFFEKYCDQIQQGIQFNQFPSELRGYYFTRPKFNEQWIDDQYKVDAKFKPIMKDGEKVPIKDSLNVGGFVDAILKDFDFNMILVDYKTSKKYKNALPDDYVRQLSIYAYLYWKQQGKLPHLVAINYLRYGESFYILVTPSLIQRAVADIKTMRERIVEWGLEKEKYYCTESKFCDWCAFKDRCDDAKKDKGNVLC